MIVTLKEFNDGTLFANVDNFTGFFDRRLKNINYDPGDEVDVIFTGISKKFLFMIPVKSNYKLLRHKGFKPTGPTWDIMAEAIFPKRSYIKLGRVPIPYTDGREIKVYPGTCWVKPINNRMFQCIGVDNPWVLNFRDGKFTMGE